MAEQSGESAGDVPAKTDASAGEARVVGLDGEGADELVSAMGSETARDVLAAVHEDPAPPSELAERLDHSLQTVHHHVENLTDAGLVEAVGTERAESGQEMTVYGPADGPVVVVAGETDDDLRSALSGLLSALGILAVASLLVQQVVGDGVAALWGGGTTTEPKGGISTASTEAAGQAGAALPPGVLFFLGGAAVLVATAAVWYWRQRSA